jgi:hypothetical protein
MNSSLDPLVNEHEAAARRLAELHPRVGWIVLLGPRQPGQGAPTIPRDQLDLEEEMRQARDDYVEKRNAYWSRLASRSRLKRSPRASEARACGDLGYLPRI